MHRVRYDTRVLDDFDKISRVFQKRIMTAIDKKVRGNPAGFGKPLRHALRNYYSLRVGVYRVVYCIESEGVVSVLIIRHRKEVYEVA